MEWKLKNHGDWLEQTASDFVSKHLSFYENIWAGFIGHKGNGTMADITNPSIAIEKKRKDFSEHHYTVLESAFFMFKITEDETKFNRVESFEEYIRMNTSLIAFYAYGGRLADNLSVCFKLMGLHLKKHPNHIAHLQTFYNARNSYLHGKKIPLKATKNGEYLIPEINEKNWDGWRKTWAQAHNMTHESVPASMNDAFSKTIELINESLKELYGLVVSFKEKHGVTLNPPEVYYRSSNTIDFSSCATILDKNVSGVTEMDVYGFRQLSTKK
jgi:hypothetical protein